MAGMRNNYQELPKAELHVHLEGSVEPETMRELAPGISLDEIRSVYDFNDFHGFLQCFKWVVQRLQAPEHYAVITRRLLERLAQQNVSYAEITLSAGVVLWKNQEFAAIYEAVQNAASESLVHVRWILDAVRQFGVEHAMAVAELAAARVNDGVVAFGIGGDEAGGPAHWFTDVFQFAKSNGLRLTAHAGETMGPESVWAALDLGAERIGHGIRSVDDPVLLRHLGDHNIPLEICITSNVATGAVASMREHPIRRIYEAGVPVILNSDDPGLFHTTLSREYELADRVFGFSRKELEEIAKGSFQHAFHAFRSESTI